MKKQHLRTLQNLLILHIVGLFSLSIQAAKASESLSARSDKEAAEILFEENWSSGNFTANNWTFEPSIGNWHINLYEGNPKPSAQFSWSPPKTNYSFSLVSRPIAITNAGHIIQLSFDLLFDDWLSTGYEKLKVHVGNGSSWYQIAEFSNTGDIPWTTYHYNVSPFITGETIQLRFEATGQTTVDIDFWRIDNIRVTSSLPPAQPSMTINPDSLFHFVPNPGSPAGWQLTLSNNGQATLYAALSVEYIDAKRTAYQLNSWIQLPDSTTFTIKPDSSIMLPINILSTNLLPGQYFANLRFESNDAQHPIVRIPAVIEVGTVGISALIKPEVVVFPQPASEIIHISCSEPIRRLRLFDFSGRILQEEEILPPSGTASLRNGNKGFSLLEMTTVNNHLVISKVLMAK